MDEVRVTEQRVPGVGVRYEVELRGQGRLVVTAERAGARHLALRPTDADDEAWQVTLDQHQAVTVAALLLGARFSTGPAVADVPDDEVTVATAVVSPGSPVLGATKTEIRLPRDGVVVAVISDSTPELVEDERSHRVLAGDRVVVAARAGDLDAIVRHLEG